MNLLVPEASVTNVFYFLVLPAVFLWIVYYKLSRARLVELGEKIPGPKAYPLIGNGLEFLGDPTQIYQKVWDLATEYSPIFRLWMGTKLFIFPMSVKDIEVILSSQKLIDKAYEYSYLHSWIGTGLLTSTGNKWHKHRKIITPTFHFKILEEFISVFNRNAQVLVQQMTKEIGSSGFDICHYITLCTLDIICESAMGTTIEAQKDSESQYAKHVKKICDIIHHRHFKPWLRPELLFKLSGLKGEQEKSIKVLHSFTNRILNERQKEYRERKFETAIKTEETEFTGIKERLAFLDLLIKASEDGKLLTNEDIREEVDTFMFEGHDTTAVGISFAIYLLAKNTDIQENVADELYRIFGDSDRDATMQDLQEMKYLERCIKESLRIYPSVPFYVRELKENVNVNGTIFPAGSAVSMFVQKIHFNPEYFPDPEKFDPDRFLPERTVNRHPYAYIPFSAGPRNCIGQKFAMLEEKAVISMILRKYKLELVNDKEKMQLQAEIILKPSNGVRVRVKLRQEEIN